MDLVFIMPILRIEQSDRSQNGTKDPWGRASWKDIRLSGPASSPKQAWVEPEISEGENITHGQGVLPFQLDFRSCGPSNVTTGDKFFEATKCATTQCATLFVAIKRRPSFILSWSA
jgi:hypothetical protein